MKHLFVVNPVAGGNRKPEKMLDTIRSVMESRRAEYEIYFTRAPMDAAVKVKAEAETGQALRVYAVGGDGTLNECANGAVGFSNTAVTHYPCGTGNDFIRMFGEEAALFRDLNRLASGVVRPIDVIDCNGRYCVNLCSTGFDARTGTDVHKYNKLPVIGGPCGYVVSLMVNMVKGINERMVITTDGKRREGEFALVCACNGRFYGGGFNPMPEALPDDGVIDTIIVGKVTRLQFLGLVGKYAKGRDVGPLAEKVHGTFIEIESDHDLTLNIDGELLKSRKATFHMIPGGLNFLFPAGMEKFSFSQEKNGKIM